MTKKNTQAGTTLTEMLVVLVIVSLLLAVSFPFSSAVGRASRIETLARTLTAKLADTRRLAMSSNREQRLYLDLEGRLVLASPANASVAIPQPVSITVQTSAGELWRKGGAFRFFPDGGATGGRIRLAEGKESREIAINWLTGAIVLSRGEIP